MKTIDGCQGEGGGQIFRSALTLAMCLGEPVTLINIRAGRKKPGLLRQHLTCLRAAQQIACAQVEGAELGSREVVFRPGEINQGKYRFSVGSAGSTTLVAQTILLPLALADGESEVTLEGGTHNPLAPSFDFLQQSFLPLMDRMGFRLSAHLERYGFHPAGGGCWCLKIAARHALPEYHPGLHLLTRGELQQRKAVAISARLPRHIAEREMLQVQKRAGWNGTETRVREVESVGPGNLVSVSLGFKNITSVFEVPGEHRLSAERVADKAVNAMRRYDSSTAVVEEFLADQLLLPMLFSGGGSFTTGEPSLHTRTNADVIYQLTGMRIEIEPQENHAWKISVPAI